MNKDENPLSINPRSGYVFALIAYDISSNKIRNLLIKILKSYGFRVQRSVFEAMISSKKLEELCGKLKRFSKEKTKDTVRVYSIPYGGRLWTFGDHEEHSLINSSDEPIVI